MPNLALEPTVTKFQHLDSLAEFRLEFIQLAIRANAPHRLVQDQQCQHIPR